MKLDGTNVVVTGAASGIGLELVRQLANSVQFNVKAIWAVDVNANALATAFGEGRLVGTNIHKTTMVTPYVCDISKPENIDKLFSEAQQLLGRIDVFIANAGFAYYERLETPDWERMEAIYKVNVQSPIYAFEKMQHMHSTMEGQVRPHKTVMMASVMAHMGLPGYALYASTKAALDRFAETHRAWEMKTPSELLLVYPIGTNQTNFCAATTAPLAWPTQTPAQVASATIVGLQHDKTRVYPSWLFNAVLLLERICPCLHRLAFYLEYRKFCTWQREQPEDAATVSSLSNTNTSSPKISEQRKQQ